MVKIANVYKDKKNQTYFFKITVKDHVTGDRKQVLRRGFPTQTLCYEAMEEFKISYYLKNKIDENSPKEKMKTRDDITLKYFYEQYYLPWYKENVKSSSYYNAIESLSKIMRYFEDWNLKDIHRLDILEFRNKLIKKGKRGGGKYSPYHLNKLINWLSQIFNLAVEYELISENPCDGIKRSTVNHKEKEIWTFDDFVYFMNCLNKEQDQNAPKILFKTIIHVLFMTGLRLGELLSLTWEDIDFQKKTLRVNKNLILRNINSSSFRDGERFSISTPKTRSSRRTIGLDDKTLEILGLWNTNQPEIAKVESNYIFQLDGDYLHDSWIRYRLYSACDKYGVRRITLHNLRHSHAAYLISLGLDPLQIQRRLGHNNVSTTLGIYGHLYPNYEFNLIEKLNNQNDF